MLHRKLQLTQLSDVPNDTRNKYKDYLNKINVQECVTIDEY